MTMFARDRRLQRLYDAAEDVAFDLPRKVRGTVKLRRQIATICHDCYSRGDSVAKLKKKVLDKLGELSPEFWDFVNKLLDALLPVLIKLLESLFNG